MDHDRWKAVNHIFHAALEVSSSERQEFVARASGGDAELQAEIDLLLKADENAGSYIETPLLPLNLFAVSPPQLHPGDVLCGRFRIVRTVGEGGMGQVFEAFDSELSAQVALKVIHPEIASHPEALARFRQEVRLARRITHKNICRTFDLERETRVFDADRGTKREIFFLTMEFLEGETLASRIKREGALPLEQALNLARQVAGALEAAKSLGVVHRDIKPANIMLVPGRSGVHGERAVITDFGLARADALHSLETSSTLSNKAYPIGTLAYMAPEQLEGADVSGATDIYSFGLVLFEMVTGRRAFPSDTLLSGITQRLAGPPPKPESIVPSLPESWCRAIEGCLHVKPGERFENIGDVVAVLDGERLALPGWIADRSWVSRWLRTWLKRERVIAVALSVCVVVALLVGGLRFTRSRADSRVAPGALIYLTQVKNETGEKVLDSLTELIHAGLAQSVQVNLLDQGRIGDTLEHMTKAPDTLIDEPTAREVAMRTGAVRVVFASVTGSAGSYSLNVDIQQPDATGPSRYRNHWTKTFSWQSSDKTGSSGVIPPEPLIAVREMSDWIRHEAGESANDIARLDVPPEDVTTGNWAALSAYAQAEKFINEGKKDEAILAYKDAIRNDPAFSLAYARLGDLLVSIRQPAEGYRAYVNALNSDSGQRLSRKERDFIQGSYASDTRDYGAALDAFRDYSAFYPSDFTGWFYQSYPLDMLDRPAEAIQALMRAEALTGQKHDGAGGMAYSYMLLGNYSAARGWIAMLRNAGWTDQALFLQALDQFLEQKYAESKSSFAELQKSRAAHFRSNGVAGVARVQAEQGDYLAALKTLDIGINDPSASENEGDKGRRWLDRAYLSCKVGNFGDCLSAVSNALSLDDSPDSILWASDILGSSYALMPKAVRPQAIKILSKMEQMIPQEDLGTVYEIARNRVIGENLLVRGNVRDALFSFRKADMLDFPLGARDYFARCLLAQADSESDAAKARDMRQEALGFYKKTALRPALVWRSVMQYPPGFAGDQMERYVALAKTMKYDSDDVHKVEQLLNGLRPNRLTRAGVGVTR
jgi:tetratricopeptide (TPR) repeat protein